MRSFPSYLWHQVCVRSATPKLKKLTLILAVLCERTVDTGHCLRHSNKYYRMIDEEAIVSTTERNKGNVYSKLLMAIAV